MTRVQHIPEIPANEQQFHWLELVFLGGCFAIFKVNISIPIGSMGLVYFTYIYHKNQPFM